MVIERLQKILSNAGIASRRVAEEMILDGRVAVNGTVVVELGARADLESDEVMVDGVPVDRSRYRYILLNKPAGIITTASDEQGRETVLDLVPIGDVKLHPVGRLDAESEGLLLLTNDGNLTQLLIHPKHEVEKQYLVGLDAPLSRADQARLVRGVMHDGERLRALSVMEAMPPVAEFEESLPAAAWVLLTLGEGKKREIRRMMTVAGKRVLLLRRVRVGPLALGTLGRGAFRELTDAEVAALYAAAVGPESRSGPHAKSAGR